MYFDLYLLFDFYLIFQMLLIIFFRQSQVSFIPMIMHFILEEKEVSCSIMLCRCIINLVYSYLSCFNSYTIKLFLFFISLRLVQFVPIKDITFTNKDGLCNPIDLKKVVEKTYKSFVDLRSDIGWFAHNLRVIYSNLNTKTSKNIIKAANKIVEAINQEITNLLLCSECYEKAYNEPDNSFLIPCKKPHILLWVDCSNYGYWPAKLMKYNDENKVFVRFFGDYTHLNVLSSKCFIFSNEIPKNEHGATRDEVFKLALDVSISILIKLIHFINYLSLISRRLKRT